MKCDKIAIGSLMRKPTTPTSHLHLQFTIFLSPCPLQPPNPKSHVWSKNWSSKHPYSHLQSLFTNQSKMGKHEYRIPGAKNIGKLRELQKSKRPRPPTETRGSNRRRRRRRRVGCFLAAVVEEQLQVPFAELEDPSDRQRPVGAYGDG